MGYINPLKLFFFIIRIDKKLTKLFVKMKIIFVVGVIALMCYFTSGVSGATASGKMNCTSGDVWTDENYCVQYICGDNGDITYNSCGAVLCGGTGVEEVEDRSKPYPECCPKCEIKKV